MKVRTCLGPCRLFGFVSLWVAVFVASPGLRGEVRAGVGVWTGNGPRAKSIEAIVADPLNPARMWAASFGSGVYRSTDGGTTWTEHRAGLINTFVRCLAVEPKHPDSVYCGTNDGVFLSTDGGVNWNKLLSTASSVRGLAIHPVKTGNVLAGTYGDGIYRSINGGKNWSQVNLGLVNINVRDIVFHPEKPETLLAATGTGGGIHRSTTGGLTWLQVADTTANQGAAEQIQFDRLNPQRIYVAELDRGVIRSTDGGLTWARINRGLATLRMRSISVVDTMRYAGTDIGGAYVSSLNDSLWHPVNVGLTQSRVDALFARPTAPFTAWAGTDGGGIFRTSNAGALWTQLDGGLLSTFAFSLAVRPSTHAVYEGSGFGDQFWRSTNAGVSWTRAASLTPHDSEHGIAVDPLLPTRVFLTSYGSGVYRSDDDGLTWTNPDGGATLTNRFVRDIVAVPATSGRLFVGTGNGVFETINAGATWVPRTSGLPASFSTRSITLVAGTPPTLYAGSDLFGVYRSVDGGLNWISRSAGLPAPFVYALLADASAGVVFAATDSGVYRTTDGGGLWAAANAGLPATRPVRALARDENHPGVVFCGISGAGVFESFDDGGSWFAVAGQLGLTDLTIRSLAVDAGTATLYAGSDNGVAAFTGYRRPPTAVAPVEPGSKLSLAIAPNPVSGATTTFRFALARAGMTTLAVFDLTGARVRVLASRLMTEGERVVVWDGRDAHGGAVAAGVYFVRLTHPDGVRAERLVLLRR